MIYYLLIYCISISILIMNTDIELENKIKISQFENSYKVNTPVFILSSYEQNGEIKLFSSYDRLVAYKLREMINESIAGIKYHVSTEKLHKDVNDMIAREFNYTIGILIHLDISKPIYESSRRKTNLFDHFLTNDGTRDNIKLVKLDPEYDEISFKNKEDSGKEDLSEEDSGKEEEDNDSGEALSN